MAGAPVDRSHRPKRRISSASCGSGVCPERGWVGRGGGGGRGLTESDLAVGAAGGVAEAVLCFNSVGLGWGAARGGPAL